MIKIKVRARETMQFPGICVACAKPGASPLSLKKRRGRLTRIVDVPLCTDCAAEVRRQSGEEERLTDWAGSWRPVLA
ncbi:MAG: hypothetical protein M5U34_48760 [Chloroflexi bacterium]|nr:hypothetical protein [Chloroflexota bacterium]